MKINVMCAGCEITVEEIDGKCVVMGMKDGELVEEFAIDCEEMEVEEAEEEMESEEEEVEELEESAEESADEASEEVNEEVSEEVSEGVKNFGDFMKEKK